MSMAVPESIEERIDTKRVLPMTWVDRAQKKLFFVLLILGAGALAGMMFLTVADIVMRYALESPMVGAYEIIELLMACVVPLGIAFCAHKHEHVVVDVLYDHLPNGAQKYLNVITSFIAALLTAVIAFYSIVTAVDTYHSKFASVVLRIPKYPIDGWVALGLVVLSLMFTLDFIRAIRKVVKK